MHYKDAKSILSPKNGLNVYRGCTHGCIYCDSRSKCYGMEHDFEDVEVKSNAPNLLKQALSRKRQPCMIGFGAMSDPYMPLEATQQLTRQCLEMALEQDCGVTLITKSDLVLRDLDLLCALRDRTRCVVQITVTTLDENLCRIVEPRVCTTARRFQVLETLRDAGIPTVVWMTPTLPFLNDTDENLDGLLEGCLRADVRSILYFGAGMTLRDGNRQYYYAKLDEHFPGLSVKYDRIYGDRYGVPSLRHRELYARFRRFCKQTNIEYHTEKIFTDLQILPPRQLSLF